MRETLRLYREFSAEAEHWRLVTPEEEFERQLCWQLKYFTAAEKWRSFTPSVIAHVMGDTIAQMFDFRMVTEGNYLRVEKILAFLVSASNVAIALSGRLVVYEESYLLVRDIADFIGRLRASINFLRDRIVGQLSLSSREPPIRRFAYKAPTLLQDHGVVLELWVSVSDAIDPVGMILRWYMSPYEKTPRIVAPVLEWRKTSRDLLVCDGKQEGEEAFREMWTKLRRRT